MRKKKIKSSGRKRLSARRNPATPKSLAYLLGLNEANLDLFKEVKGKPLGAWGINPPAVYLLSIAQWLQTRSFNPELDDFNTWELGYVTGALLSLSINEDLTEEQKGQYSSQFVEVINKLKTAKYKSGLIIVFANTIFSIGNKGPLTFIQINRDINLGENFAKFVLSILIQLHVVQKSFFGNKFSLTKKGIELKKHIRGYDKPIEDKYFSEILNVLRGEE